MGAPANFVWLPLLLMAMIVSTAPLVKAQKNDTESSSSKFESSSSSSTPSSTTIRSTTISSATTSTTTRPSPSTVAPSKIVIADDLKKAARVDQINSEIKPSLIQADQPREKSPDGGSYDVIDVLGATGAGVAHPKSGQTTRIYTSGEVNDDFWLKHLGDDFKHAIHLQVGGTNDDYNRIINQSKNGVHEEVHHEYMPGSIRSPEHAQQQDHYQHHYHQQHQQQQHGYEGEASALKDNYMSKQEQQYAHRYEQLHSAHFNNRHTKLYNTDRHTYPNTQHNTYNTHDTHDTHNTHDTHDNQNTQIHTRAGSKSHHRYKPNSHVGHPPALSSEESLHAAQTQSAAASAMSSSFSSFDSSQLPFKSQFNDYGNRPTRDLAYLLYKRGL